MVFSEDMKELLTLFQKHHVAFAVCGGFAVAHYGYVRATMDFDILVLPSPENAEKIQSALTEFGFGAAGIPPEALLGFQEEEFQRAAGEGPTIDITFYDPAARDTVNHDFKAIVLLSRAANGIAYVRDAWIRRLSVDAVVDKTYAHHHEFPTAEQWFEANGFQVLYKTVFELKAMLEYDGEELELEEYTTTLNKNMMIEALSGFVNTGRIRFKQNPDGSWYGDIGVLIKQLMDFPRGKKKDGADALSKAHAIALDKSRTAAYGTARRGNARRRDRARRRPTRLRRFFDALRP
jgi:hypothetical protein